MGVFRCAYVGVFTRVYGMIYMYVWGVFRRAYGRVYGRVQSGAWANLGARGAGRYVST